jgi:CSLREA domain-containing protein
VPCIGGKLSIELPALSVRAFRRERERRVASAWRREQLRLRRAGLAAGVTAGAFALAPAAAQAADFEVNTLADTPPEPSPGACTTDDEGCTLREAINDASANSEPDLITFQSGLTGTLLLTQGQLSTSSTVADDITIQGPGADAITISGDPNENGHDAGDSRIFNVLYANDLTSAATSLTLSGLTLSEGYVTSGIGGAIFLGEDNELSLADSRITDSETTSSGGGAIGGDGGKYSQITVTDSTISGNEALGGGAIQQTGPVTIDDSTLSDNHAVPGGGGAVAFGAKYGPLQITDSVISGNTAGSGGGAVSFSPSGGPKYTSTDSEIANTTISGNSAASAGGAMTVGGLLTDQGSLTITHSTLSGNYTTNTTSYGGAIDTAGDTMNGTFRVVDSTVSGSDAGAGGGISVRSQVGPNGSISADNSTIASNTVTYEGGGLWAVSYGPPGGPYTSPPIELNSTIVGNNTAGGTPDDLGRANLATSGGFQLSFSLVEAPGDAIDTQANSITGQDPQLGGLASNGGPTLTQLPAITSPAIDAGSNPLALATDQRGQPRTINGPPANAGDGTDIGAVERSEVATSPSPPVTQPPKKAKKCKKKKKGKKRSAESSKKKPKKCKKKKKKRR